MTNTNDDGRGRQEVIHSDEALSQPTLAVDLERAQIDQQIATAHRYPRVLDTVLKKIKTMAMYTEAAAENCVYSLPRGGKPIIGASIGFANILSQAWGNNRDGARIVYIDRKEKTVVAEGAFLDLETNHQTIVPVSRRIVDKHGRLYTDDMILVTGMAAASIARRNAILNAVPRALWYPIWEDALRIVRGDMETFAERKDKALRAFAQFGVKPEQIFMVLGLKGEPDLTIEHIPSLRGMYQALRDGSATVEEMFDPRRMTGTGFEVVENPLADEEPGARATVQTAPKASPANGGAPAEAPDAPDDGHAPELEKSAPAKPAGAKRGRPPKVRVQPEPGPKKPEQPKAATPPTPPPSTEAAQAPEDQSLDDEEGDDSGDADGEGQADRKPTTCEEYVAYATKQIEVATSATALEDRWKSDRDLRTACRVVEDAFAAIREKYSDKLTELRISGR